MASYSRPPIGSGQPRIRVGLMASRTVDFSLTGRYRIPSGEVLEGGDYTASLDEGQVRLSGAASRFGSGIKSDGTR